MRPADPPPLGVSVRLALPLPHPSPRRPRHRFPSPRNPGTRNRDPISPCHQGRIKAKNPAIVHNQGSSRQTLKYSNTIMPPLPHPRTALSPVAPTGSRLYRQLATGVPWQNRPLHHSLGNANTTSLHQSRQNPQQSSLIKPHQGKSRQIKANAKIVRGTRHDSPRPEIRDARPNVSPICVHPRLSAVKFPIRISRFTPRLPDTRCFPQQSCIIKSHQG